MGETKRLLALQEVDTAIDRLAVRRVALEGGAALAAVRREADAAEEAFGELRLQIDVMNRDAGRFEHEIDTIAQKAAAEQKRLYDGSVANAKELGSLQHEVENLTKRRVEREDELLALMEQREDLETRAKEAEAKAAELRANTEAAAVSAREELAAIAADLDAKVAERASIVPDIDTELLELYEDLRPQKKGVAAAALVDGVCQGCHEKLSAMELDKLKRTDDVKRCEYCRRILVL